MDLSITVTHASAEQVTVELIKPAGMATNKPALRTLIMQTVAYHLNAEKVADLYEKGWDRQHEIGWEWKAGPKPSTIGRARVIYTIRPMTRVEKDQALHDRGGVTKNRDGSMSFWLPGERPAPVTQTVKVKHQK